MSYEQWVVPNTSAEDNTGACLRFVQRVFRNGNPHYYRSAWIAWLKAEQKSYERNIPADAAVPVYFSHWGRYNDGLGQYGDNPNDPYYGNWGHVVAWIPGHGYLSSPASGEGRQWFQTIEEIERTFNAKFVGWALDVGGLYVAWPRGVPYPGVTPAPAPTPNVKPKPIPAPAPTPLEEIMANPTYIRDAKDPQSAIFALNPVTGKKRKVPTPEWNGIRAAERAGGEKVVIGLVSADELKSIPNA